MDTHVSLSNFLHHMVSRAELTSDQIEKNTYMNIAHFLVQIFDKTGYDTLDCIPSDRIFLRNHEKKVTSQFGEDGIIEKIFEIIGTTNKKYLEFGATSEMNNTQNLHENHGFTGTLWGSEEHCDYNTIHNEFVTVENVGKLCENYSIDKELDFLSIDIDGNDWYVWREISKYTKPRVVVIEYNGEFRVDDDKVIPYDPKFTWDRETTYFGATLRALFNLGRTLGYSLVCCNRHGNNAFFIRDDCIPKDTFYGVNDYKLLYRSLHSTGNHDEYYKPSDKHWLSSTDLL